MDEPLDSATLEARLAELSGWTGATEGISRTAELADFPTAIRVVDRVATVAEQLNHHPDIDIRWRTVTFRLSTHSAGGRVTGLDTDLARRINEIIASA